MNNFDKNGYAIKDFRIKVYQYSPVDFEYIGTKQEHIVIGTGIPANSTLVDVFLDKEGFTQVFDEASQTWSYVEDHRYSDVYNIHTKQKENVLYIGELKAEHTLLEPPSFYHDFINSEWIITEEKQAELNAQIKQQKIDLFESTVQKLENDLVVANLRGKDITEILNELDSVEAELNALKGESK